MIDYSVPWSHSSMDAFETCPRRYMLTKVKKSVKEPPTEATKHGNAVHDAMAKAIKGEQALPPKYEGYTKYVDMVRRSPGTKTIEEKVALNKDFKQTSFFAKDAWLRVIVDAAIVFDDRAVLLDWKTGKRKMSDQLALSAAVGFALWPFVKKIETAFVWLPDRKVDKETFAREEAPALWSPIFVKLERMERAHATDTFPPKPSGLCKKWCPVGRANCEFCGE